MQSRRTQISLNFLSKSIFESVAFQWIVFFSFLITKYFLLKDYFRETFYLTIRFYNLRTPKIHWNKADYSAIGAEH